MNREPKFGTKYYAKFNTGMDVVYIFINPKATERFV